MKWRYNGIEIRSDLFGRSNDSYRFILGNQTIEFYEGNYTCEVILPNAQLIVSPVLKLEHKGK